MSNVDEPDYAAVALELQPKRNKDRLNSICREFKPDNSVTLNKIPIVPYFFALRKTQRPGFMIMELHYKVYQKVKIYIDKIRCALINLETLKIRTVLAQGEKLVKLRFEALRLVQAELVRFCLNLKNSAPYVPSSRCKAITSWYGCTKLQWGKNPSDFQKDLVEADREVIEEADFIISDPNAPPVLKNTLEKHVECFKKMQKPVKISNEN